MKRALCSLIVVVIFALSACWRPPPPPPPTPTPTPLPSPTPLPVADEEPVEVAVDVTSTEVGLGETTEVAVWVWRVGNLYGAEVHISFDPNLLEVVDSHSGALGTEIEHGDLLDVGYVIKNDVDNEHGLIDYAVSQMRPSHSVSGSGRLATIRFRAKALGTAVVRIDQALLANKEGQPIPMTLDGATSLVIRDGSDSQASYRLLGRRALVVAPRP